jgi:hypothetical protein
MIEVTRLFDRIVQASLSEVSNDTLRGTLQRFVLRYKASPINLWFTQKAITQIYTEYLEHADVQSFLDKVTTRFTAYLGHQQKLANLAYSLAMAACVDGVDPTQSYFPLEIKKDLPGTLFGSYDLQGNQSKSQDPVETLRDVLVSNPHLMVFMLFNLSITESTP